MKFKNFNCSPRKDEKGEHYRKCYLINAIAIAGVVTISEVSVVEPGFPTVTSAPTAATTSFVGRAALRGLCRLEHNLTFFKAFNNFVNFSPEGNASIIVEFVVSIKVVDVQHCLINIDNKVTRFCSNDSI